jgi:hypothetical protein
MPFISLAQAHIMSLEPVIPRHVLPILQGARHPELLAEDNKQAIHQAKRLFQLAQHGSVFKPVLTWPSRE